MTAATKLPILERCNKGKLCDIMLPPACLLSCRLGTHQRINHFHGMLELCRKRSMARALAALAAAAPRSAGYDFFPATWQLPDQLGEFLAAAKASGRKGAFIVKPDAGCQVRDQQCVHAPT